MATLQFLGATGTVTGSKYLLEAGGERLMIDCGLFQGLKELRLRNWNPLPISPSSVHYVALTHAHLDHTGYVPKFVKDGFRGPVLATPATIDLAGLVLPDSGHLQEEDAAYANRKGFSKHAPALPLYTHDDAMKSLESFRALNGPGPFEISPHFSLRYFRAGHILGARMIEVTVRENNITRTVLFSGDIGRTHQLIIREPVAPDSKPDYLLCESTYGDRLHPDDDYRSRLAAIVESTAARGGSVIIPAFAIGRTQELLFLFRELIQQGKMHELPIHVDSPMAIDATDLYRRHHEDHNLAAEDLERNGLRLFSQPYVHFDRTVEQSKALNDTRFPTIIISASGMASGGRVVHHLARCLPDHRNTILLVGFQAAGTRGHTIQSGAKEVKMLGQMVPIRARVETMDNLSGHADYGEILRLLGAFKKAPQTTFMVHGEPKAAESLKEKIAAQLGWNVRIPQYLEKVTL
ncbi:MAG TPA: MBL fold metallo-hydrolase [Terriglobia bacterium]|nr:MBL fold metallo-hydrolase [Terriglobia bacterium]